MTRSMRLWCACVALAAGTWNAAASRAGSYGMGGAWRRLRAVGLVLAMATAASMAPLDPAVAAETDCIGQSEDGRAVCSLPEPGPWSYSLCDEAGSYVARYAAWCRAAGGTYHGVYAPEECTGRTVPTTESTLHYLAKTFAEKLYNQSCGASDTGWGITVNSNLCWSGGTLTQNNIITRQMRRFGVSCSGGAGETITALKGRDLVCPSGTTSRTWNGQTVCVHPVVKCQCSGVGNPITPEAGQKVQVENDGSFDGRTLSRRYMSFGSAFAPGATQDAQSFGVRWRDSFDYRLQPMTGTSVAAALSLPDGSIQYFRNDGSAVLGTQTNSYRFTNTGSGYDIAGAGEFLRFSTTGKLVSLTTAGGRLYTLTYSDGTAGGANGQLAKDASDAQTSAPVPANQLIKVESDTGRILRYERDVAGKITQMRIGTADPTRYFYSNIDLLEKVVYPGGQTRLYHYNEAAQTGGANLPRTLTGISDLDASANPVRYASYFYDGSGKAISTQHAGGLERYDLQYASATQTVVTDPLGTQRTMTYANVQGVKKLVSTAQPAGSGSAAVSSTVSYDANGNVASTDDFNGNRTCSAYDVARSLETVRVEGLANTQACSGVIAGGASLPAGSRKSSKQWHPQWALESKLAEPRRITTNVYNGQPDPFNGNATASCAPATAMLPSGQPIMVLCRRVEQATTDVDGSQGFAATLQSGVPARENKWTYNARGQVLTHDGPRTDVSDITTYAYYADTTPEHTRGDLQSTTNPAGHVTQYTIYDAEGRVKRSVAPNGVVTETNYTPRGWISSSTVTAAATAAQTTTYTHEVDGQPATVTLPDGTTLTYSYDTGRRMTGITDSAGNTVNYTLDSAGNRIAEQYKDPNGTLARDISRVYDALGRVMTVSGAAQ